MKKLSRETTALWRFFGVGFLIVHPFLLVVIICINFWPLYLVYLALAVGHLMVAKVWRYLLLTNVYITDDFDSLIVKTDAGKSLEYSMKELSSCKTISGITDLIISTSTGPIKIYFMPNSSESLKHLIDRTF
jgi:hypothetical protein